MPLWPLWAEPCHRQLRSVSQQRKLSRWGGGGGTGVPRVTQLWWCYQDWQCRCCGAASPGPCPGAPHLLLAAWGRTESGGHPALLRWWKDSGILLIFNTVCLTSQVAFRKHPSQASVAKACYASYPCFCTWMFLLFWVSFFFFFFEVAKAENNKHLIWLERVLEYKSSEGSETILC